MRRGAPSGGERSFRRAIQGLLLASGALVGGAAAGGAGIAGGAAAGLGGAGLVEAMARRRERRRERVLSQPLPRSWRERLPDLASYARLPEPLRARFEDDLRLFTAAKPITGVGIEVDEQLRLLVAASAVTLSLGWPDFDWEPLGEVLLYPDDFDRDYSAARGDDDDRAGEAHAWGTVILSVPSLYQSWDEPGDAFHVGFHELAHLLDVEQTEFDGIPIGLSGEAQREWVALREKEMRRIDRGRSVLDPYGAEDPIEFFPVAVEAFFDCPVELRRRHAQLYALLAGWFAQDPADWEQRHMTNGRRGRRTSEPGT